MPDALGTTITLELPFDVAMARTRDALKTEGFGILTEIDVAATFKAKLDREFRPYVILGACNPPLAWRALHANAEVGLLLPCNVTVEADEAGRTIVRIVDPMQMLAAADPAANADIQSVAAEAGERLARVAGALGGRTSSEGRTGGK
ncbi:MAG: DUF302 domain-containing protein [Gemmatimonadales bacterium]